MALILHESDCDELYKHAPVTCPNDRVFDDFEELIGVPELLGRGYNRGMDLLPGVERENSESTIAFFAEPASATPWVPDCSDLGWSQSSSLPGGQRLSRPSESGFRGVNVETHLSAFCAQ